MLIAPGTWSDSEGLLALTQATWVDFGPSLHSFRQWRDNVLSDLEVRLPLRGCKRRKE